MLQRTQLMLDLNIKKQLERIAFVKGRSLSGLVREILKKEVTGEEKKIKGSGVTFLKKLTASSVSGPGNSDYDRYFY